MPPQQQDFLDLLEKEEEVEEPEVVEEPAIDIKYLGVSDGYDVMFRAGTKFYIYRLRFVDWVNTVRLMAVKSPAKALNWAKSPDRSILGAEVRETYPMPGSIIKFLEGYVVKP